MILFLQLIIVGVTIFQDFIGSAFAIGKLGPIVNITSGLVQGSVEWSRNEWSFHQFLGIPYGHVPKRFMDSELAQPWKGVKSATKFGSTCEQFGYGHEDCLVLNIFTPTLPSDSPEKLPVLVSIHGGGFILGMSNVYGPKYFMDENIVLVTLNYRLGVLGFLNLGIDEAPGNQGMKDQVLALKWVQENIEFFNGDKSRVTIFGESAGGASVSYLLISPLSKGLFHSAISQSGTALCPWAFDDIGERASVKLAESLHCKGTRKQMWKCLVDKNIFDIMAHAVKNGHQFVPSVENRKSENSTIFLPKTPWEMMASGYTQAVPYILGITASEGLAFTRFMGCSVITAAFKFLEDSIIPSALRYNNRPDYKNITDEIKQFYLNDNCPDIHKNFTDAVSDRMWNYCTRKAAQFHAKSSPTYLYHFEKSGGFSLMSTLLSMGKHPPVPTHADDLTYHFDLNIAPFVGSYIGPKDPGYNFSRNFVRLWTSFAQGNMSHMNWNSQALEWDSLESAKINDYKWLHLDEDIKTVAMDENFQNRMAFWEKLNLTV